MDLAGQVPIRREAAGAGQQAPVFAPAFEVRAHSRCLRAFDVTMGSADFKHQLAAEMPVLALPVRPIPPWPNRVICIGPAILACLV
jgi:hypothetical protein